MSPRQAKQFRNLEPQQDWTWKLWNHTARYNRVYIYSHAAVQTECVLYHVHDGMREKKLIDHAAVSVELRCHQLALSVDTSAAAPARTILLTSYHIDWSDKHAGCDKDEAQSKT